MATTKEQKNETNYYNRTLRNYLRINDDASSCINDVTGV